MHADKGSANSTDTAAGSETESAAQSASESASETETETEDTNAYAYDYDVESLVKLGDYKGLTYTETDTSVSDEEVESQINSTLTAHATPEQIKTEPLKTVIQSILTMKARLMVRLLKAVQPQVHH